MCILRDYTDCRANLPLHSIHFAITVITVIPQQEYGKYMEIKPSEFFFYSNGLASEIITAVPTRLSLGSFDKEVLLRRWKEVSRQYLLFNPYTLSNMLL